jgi:hypothetical protein
MKRFDRAMYAFFLLALLADVARAHASVPIGMDATDGLILTAGSRLGSAGGAILPGKPVLRRTDGISSKIDRGTIFRLLFAGWSRNLSHISNSATQSAPALISSGFAVASPSPFRPPAQGTYEHTGSPAP